MKIRLLRDVYCGVEGIKFPVEVEAEPGLYGNYNVHEDELARIGCDRELITDPDDPVWPFTPGDWEAAE